MNLKEALSQRSPLLHKALPRSTLNSSGTQLHAETPVERQGMLTPGGARAREYTARDPSTSKPISLETNAQNREVSKAATRTLSSSLSSALIQKQVADQNQIIIKKSVRSRRRSMFNNAHKISNEASVGNSSVL